MQLHNVTNEDGKRCANLINFLKAGRWDLSGSDAEELVRVKKWVHDLAVGMAHELRAAPKPATSPASGFKVKSIGKLPTSKTKQKKK